MILSGIEIKNRLGKDIFIDPFDEKRLNPNSYNLRLANDILMYGKRNEINDFVKPTLDMKKQNEFVRGKIPEEGMDAADRRELRVGHADRQAARSPRMSRTSASLERTTTTLPA